MPHFAYAFRLAGFKHFYVGESRGPVLIKDKDQFKIWFYYLLAWTSLVERTDERTHSCFGPALIPHGVLFFFFPYRLRHCSLYFGPLPTHNMPLFSKLSVGYVKFYFFLLLLVTTKKQYIFFLFHMLLYALKSVGPVILNRGDFSPGRPWQCLEAFHD